MTTPILLLALNRAVASNFTVSTSFQTHVGSSTTRTNNIRDGFKSLHHMVVIRVIGTVIGSNDIRANNCFWIARFCSCHSHAYSCGQMTWADFATDFGDRRWLVSQNPATDQVRLKFCDIVQKIVRRRSKMIQMFVLLQTSPHNEHRTFDSESCFFQQLILRRFWNFQNIRPTREKHRCDESVQARS